MYGQISREDSLQYAEAVFILCHDKVRPTVAPMGRLPVLSRRLGTQMYNTLACCLFRKMVAVVMGGGGESLVSMAQMKLVIFLSTFFHFSHFLFFELRSTEHPGCLFGSGIIFHVYDT